MQQYLWIFLILIYGISKGFREALKKKAMETCSIIEVLLFYTLFAFVLTIPFSIGENIFDVSFIYHIIIFFKAGIIFLSWIVAMNAIKRLPLSIYCVMDMGRMLFSILLGIIFLGEGLGLLQGIGMTLVLAGVTLVNLKNDRKTGEKTTYKVIPLVIFSCFLNGVSSVIDKFTLSTDPTRWLLKDDILSTAQMQFWYMLYLSLFYIAYALIRMALKKEKIDIVKCLKCPWIYVLSLLFMLADRAMFIANTDPNSTVVIMTLLKQVSVLVTITLGKFIYKEKHILYRVGCAGLIIAGIVLSVI